MQSARSQQNMPQGALGFEHIKRYWDKQNGVWAARILPGELYVSSQGEMVSTVLGSCISACIRDRVKGIGGMNHFMLPEENEHSSANWGDSLTQASRYGNWAMEFLINEILKRGGKKENLEVKLFGGGQMMASTSDIGQKNIIFAYNYLAQEHLKIEASDIGDIYARKVLYFTDTGRVKIKRMVPDTNANIIRREKDYQKEVSKPQAPSGGDVELF